MFLFDTASRRGKGFFVLSYLDIAILLEAFFTRFHVSVFGVESHSAFAIGDVKLLMVVYVLLRLNNEERIRLFQYIIKIFVIAMIPGFIYWIMCLAGIPNVVPYTVIQRRFDGLKSNEQYYFVYPFGCVLETGILGYRFCGIFDEPGVVGTIAAFLYMASYGRAKKKWSRLVLLIGIASLATAFFVEIALFYLIRTIYQRKYKTALRIVAILSCYIFITSITSDNIFIIFLQEKANIHEMMTRRNTTKFSEYFASFQRGGGYPLWFGQGRDSSVSINDGTYSFILVLYEYGIIGSAFMIGIFFFTFFREKSKSGLVFLICFLASMYQRPFMYTHFYYSVFICALTYLKCTGDAYNERKLLYMGTYI